jgi:hypothetical protein
MWNFLMAVFLVPGMAVAEFWRCQAGTFYLDPQEHQTAFSCLRESLAAGSGWRVLPEEIQPSTSVQNAGGFNGSAKDWLNHSLLMNRLPQDHLINVEDIQSRSQNMTVAQVYQLIMQDWLKAYCSK